MSFPYRPIEADEIQIEPTGNLQDTYSTDDTFCPSKPVLRHWPFWIGLAQIGVGFLCALFSCLDVFIILFVTDIESGWSLNISNAYGAGLWSGFMLVLAGSTAVRAAKYRELYHVIQFYSLTVAAFICNLALMIVTLWAFKQNCSSGKDISMSITSSVWCLIGCLLLNLTFTGYMKPVLFGEVRLLHRLGVCFLPCIFGPVPSASNSRQSVNSTESNLIV